MQICSLLLQTALTLTLTLILTLILNVIVILTLHLTPTPMLPSQMAKVRELVGEMATIQMEYGESFWGALRPVQHARGLTATPHTIYDVNALGIEIGGHGLGSRSST